jgi:hypothetical protein
MDEKQQKMQKNYLWPSLRFNAKNCLGSAENHNIPQLRQPASGLRFEPDTFKYNAGMLTITLQYLLLVLLTFRIVQLYKQIG